MLTFEPGGLSGLQYTNNNSGSFIELRSKKTLEPASLQGRKVVFLKDVRSRIHLEDEVVLKGNLRSLKRMMRHTATGIAGLTIGAGSLGLGWIFSKTVRTWTGNLFLVPVDFVKSIPLLGNKIAAIWNRCLFDRYAAERMNDTVAPEAIVDSQLLEREHTEWFDDSDIDGDHPKILSADDCNALNKAAQEKRRKQRALEKHEEAENLKAIRPFKPVISEKDQSNKVAVSQIPDTIMKKAEDSDDYADEERNLISDWRRFPIQSIYESPIQVSSDETDYRVADSSKTPDISDERQVELQRLANIFKKRLKIGYHAVQPHRLAELFQEALKEYCNTDKEREFLLSLLTEDFSEKDDADLPDSSDFDTMPSIMQLRTYEGIASEEGDEEEDPIQILADKIVFAIQENGNDTTIDDITTLLKYSQSDYDLFKDALTKKNPILSEKFLEQLETRKLFAKQLLEAFKQGDVSEDDIVTIESYPEAEYSLLEAALTGINKELAETFIEGLDTLRVREESEGDKIDAS